MTGAHFARRSTPAIQILTRFRMHLLLLSLAVSGCGPRVVPASSLDAAETALREALDAWKSGASVEDQRRRSTPVYVSDELWQEGSKLLDYRLVASGEQHGSNVRFQVELACRHPSGRKQKQNVSYLISTEPAITIARQE